MQIKIQASANSDKLVYGTAEVTEASKDKLFFKALIRITIWWALAIVAILIPVLHFILVPAFFLTGIYMAMKALKLSMLIESGRVDCPHCGQNVDLPKSAAAWPHTEICQNCASVIQFEPAK